MIILKLQKMINNSNTDEDIFVNISHYLLKRIRKDNSKLTTEDIASDCFTSSASVSRFVRELGYKSFSDFKQIYLLTAIELEEMKIDLQVSANSSNLDSTKTTNHGNRIVEGMNDMISSFNYQELSDLSDMIFSAEEVSLFASHIPGNISEILQHQLLTAGKHTLCYPTYDDQMKNAEKLSKNDLAIVSSLNGSYLMSKELTIKITNSDAKTVLITQNPTVKFSASFDYVIALGEKDHEAVGKYKLMLYFELLARCYYQRHLS